MTGLSGAPNPLYKDEVEKALDELTENDLYEKYKVFYHLDAKGLLIGCPDKDLVSEVVRLTLERFERFPVYYCGPGKRAELALILKIAKLVKGD